MMVVDTSAIMAMVLEEQGSEQFLDTITAEPTALMSAGTLLELDVVCLRRGRAPMRELMHKIIQVADLIIMPVEGANLAFARRGFARFGVGRGEEPSALNYGDCFAYGLAMAENAPLLFKGEDFLKTDVKVAALA